MFRRKSGLAFFLFLVTGAIVGGLASEVLQTTQFLGESTKFLVQKYEVFSFPPSLIDFYVLKFSVGFSFQPNLVSILGVMIAFFIFNRF